MNRNVQNNNISLLHDPMGAKVKLLSKPLLSKRQAPATKREA
jgi:hypothetical protein